MSPASGAPGDEPTRTARPPGGRWAVLSSGGPRVAAYAALALLLVVLPLSGFLFGSGGVLFQNWNWSISPARIVPAPSVLDPYLWNPAGPDAAGYTRAITAWPPFLLLGATHDPFAIERAYLAFVYLVEFGLAFIGGTLLLRLVPELPRGATREALRMAFIGASFVNPAALQWEAGVVVPFLWGSSLIAIALLATLRVTRSGDLRSALLAGVSLGVGATLDPRILAWGALGMGIVLAIEAVRLRGVARMVRPVGVAAVGALPGALLTAFAYVWTGAIEGAPIRSGTYDAIATASTNSGPLRVLELLGFNISGLTYAPPTVLGAALHGSNTSLLGVPPFLWLDGSLAGSLWLFLIAVPPVLAFGALLDRRQRALALPLAAVALASGLLAMGTQAPSDALVQGEVALGGIQFAGFGSVVQTIV
ncbi:MAG TPA: hypothetical protein VMH78_03425, partial [Thermoplasmata archaeon]|nr:hypothetical protein [Thermoplasmata archaeon]